MAKISEVEVPFLQFEDRDSDPATPPAGFGFVYLKDGVWHTKKDTGAVTEYGAGGGGASGSGVRVTATSPGNFVTSEANYTAWDTAAFDDDDYWSVSPNPERLTVPAGHGGLFLATLSFDVSAQGSNRSYYMYLQVNGSGVASSLIRPRSPSAGDMGIGLAQPFRLDAGDYLQVRFNGTHADPIIRPFFGLVRIGN